MNRNELSELSIDIEGYSGPFDLLCSLAEDRKFQLTDIKISQLIKIYGLYLLKTRQSPADTLAEFFYMASGLLLEKTHSLIPGNDKRRENDSPDEKSENENESENNKSTDTGEKEFIRTLERYMPYRKVYLWLEEKFNAQSLLFRRENKMAGGTKSKIIIDSGDADLLAETWKDLFERHIELTTEEQELYDAESRADWDGFAESDEQQIDARVSEIEDMLNISQSLSFNMLCSDSSKHNIVTTLLAMLELCRMGKILIEQEELFSDVRIISKT